MADAGKAGWAATSGRGGASSEGIGLSGEAPDELSARGTSGGTADAGELLRPTGTGSVKCGTAGSGAAFCVAM